MHPVIDKLKAKTLIHSETGCWLWQGPLDSAGYGFISELSISSNPILVHRLSAHLYHGLDLSNRHELSLHKSECKNKCCWNPEHLYAGTQFDNVQDAIKAGTYRSRLGISGVGGPTPESQRKIVCDNGHKMTDQNTYKYKVRGGYIAHTCKMCKIEKQRERRTKTAT